MEILGYASPSVNHQQSDMLIIVVRFVERQTQPTIYHQKALHAATINLHADGRGIREPP